MRWNWLRDKQTLENLLFFWDAGTNNYADYFTKHHPPSHHLAMRPTYILNGHNAVSSYASSYSAITPSFPLYSMPLHVQGCVLPWAVTNG